MLEPPDELEEVKPTGFLGTGGAAFRRSLDCECDGGDDVDSAYDSDSDPVRARAEVGGGGSGGDTASSDSSTFMCVGVEVDRERNVRGGGDLDGFLSTRTQSGSLLGVKGLEGR